MSSVISVVSVVKNLLPHLERTIPNIKFHKIENPGTDKQFKDSQIIIADFDLISPYVYHLPKVKWIQGTWAGVDKLMKVIEPSNPPNFCVTRFSGKHFGSLMSEYVISNIVNFERQTFQIRDNQKLKLWNKDGKIEQHRAIFELTIGVLGIGSIGNRVAETLNSLGATILGYGRQSTFKLENNKHISKYFTKNELPEMLQHCDYIINILPTTEETKGLLNGNILENCKKKQAVFVNVGRGTIISEDSLVNALENKWISGAILDVFEEEPLKSTSYLWDIPNVIITPHVSAMSRPQDIADHFKENLVYFKHNLPIPATVDFFAGY